MKFSSQKCDKCGCQMWERIKDTNWFKCKDCGHKQAHE